MWVVTSLRNYLMNFSQQTSTTAMHHVSPTEANETLPVITQLK